jgi:hypothetical protein
MTPFQQQGVIMHIRLSRALALGAVIAIASGVAANAASIQTVYVSNSGSNVAGCGFFASPCKGINYALTNSVAADGQIVVLDAGYATGPLAINKAVSIVANANVTVIPNGSFGIRIAAGAGKVVLKGLTVDGSGGGTYGIDVQSAGSVSIIDCVVHHFANNGIFIEPNTSLKYDVTDTTSVDNGGSGVYVVTRAGGNAIGTISNVNALRNGGNGVTIDASGGGTSIAHIQNTRSNQNAGVGFAKYTGGSFYLATSTATANANNIVSAGGGGPGYTYGNNFLTGNTSDNGVAYLSPVSAQ